MKLDLPFNVTYYKNPLTDLPVGLFLPDFDCILYILYCQEHYSVQSNL